MLSSNLRPDHVVAYNWHCFGNDIYRIKFLGEYKQEQKSVHQDFIKMVTLLRLAHTLYQSTGKDVSKHATSLRTYGLLADEKQFWVIALSFDGQDYVLENLGKYDLNVTESEMDVKKRIELCSLLLTAGYETAKEQEKVIAERTTSVHDSPFTTPRKSAQLQPTMIEIGTTVAVEFNHGSSINLRLVCLSIEITSFQEKNDDKSIFFGNFCSDKDKKFPLCIKQSKKTLNSAAFNALAFKNVNHLNLEITLKGSVLSATVISSEEEKKKIIIQLLSELKRLHDSKIIHNDVKPSNIVIYNGVARLIDYEIHHKYRFEYDESVYNENREMITSRSGSPSYNAPEKIKEGNYSISPKTDVYSMGLVFIELILDKRVKIGELHRDELTKRCHFFPNLSNVILKMISEEKEKRPTAFECLLEIGKDKFKSSATDFCEDVLSQFEPEELDLWSIGFDGGTEHLGSTKLQTLENPEPTSSFTPKQTKCKCRAGCKNKQCGCRKISDFCSIECGCGSNCQNREDIKQKETKRKKQDLVEDEDFQKNDTKKRKSSRK